VQKQDIQTPGGRHSFNPATGDAMPRLRSQARVTAIVVALTAWIGTLAIRASFGGQTLHAAGPEAAFQSQSAAGDSYRAVVDWLKLPPGRPEASGLRRYVGNMHGDIAVSSQGDVYVSVQALDKNNQPLPEEDADPLAGVQVYSADGRYIRNVRNAPSNLHGFVIHKEADGEFIYAVRLATGPKESEQAWAGLPEQAIVKLTLDGEVVRSISAAAIPDRFKNKNPADGRPYLRLTGIAVAPNGDIYVSDGYASDYIHRFDRTGKYLASFGGSGEPYNFRTLHKLAIDTRFSPPRLIACDRANNRVVHLSLNGEMLGIVASGLLLPAAVAIHGDHAAIAELKGRVTLVNKDGLVVARLGTNDVADEVGTKLIEPTRWRPGISNAPHGIAFDSAGDLFVSEFSIFGRVLRFDKPSGAAR
jgi:hypothetical protein